MQNRKHKGYQSSYRKQLIQLAKFYGIIEVKNYLKSAKKLTNSQIELILVKNKIKLPAKKVLSKINRLISFKNIYLSKFLYACVVVGITIGLFGGAPHMIDMFHKIDHDSRKDNKEKNRTKNTRDRRKLSNIRKSTKR